MSWEVGYRFPFSFWPQMIAVNPLTFDPDAARGVAKCVSNYWIGVRIQHKHPHPCQDKLIKHLEFPEFLSSLIFYLRPTLFYYQKRAKHQVFPWGSVAINSASCKSLLNSSQLLAVLMVSCRRRRAERRCKVEFLAAASRSRGCSAVQHSDHKLKLDGTKKSKTNTNEVRQ